MADERNVLQHVNREGRVIVWGGDMCRGNVWIPFIFRVLLLKNQVLNVTSDKSDNKDTLLCN